MDDPRLLGIVLAAGAGTRYGGPKALARDGAGTPWLVRVTAALAEGGCGELAVVLGAAPEAADLLPAGVRIVLARDWADGLSRSVAAGLDAAMDAAVDAVVLAPVDVPELPASAVTRVREAASTPRTALVRATYGGRPGHPVLIGADRFGQVRAGLTGDVGAGPVLTVLGAAGVACEDLWSGRDRDTR